MNNNVNFPKQPLKLIDVLNMIANSELKQNTQIIWNDTEYILRDGIFLRYIDFPNARIFLLEDMAEKYRKDSEWLNDEVELIEPPCEHECISDDGITLELSKIEELEGKIEALGAVDLAESWMVHYIRENRNKLNEVIRKVNAITNLLN